MQMKRTSFIIGIIAAAVIISTLSFTKSNEEDIAALRKAYSSGDYKLWPKVILEEGAKLNFRDIGSLDSMPYPADNKPSPEKKDLGKILFFDPRLSVSGQIACASCHEPQLGWGDGKRVANGHDRKMGARNSMSLLNVGYYEKYFWDGRANSLEDQAKFPVKDHIEMNLEIKAMEKKIKSFKGYEPLFEKAFGNKEINLEKIFKAIATFERSIVSPPSRFDNFIKGKSEALKDDEVLGLHLFRTKAGCINCHNTPFFSDNKFHNDGQTLFASESEDLGRYNFTSKIEDVGKFKTPSLRETANTGPWMHHGNFPSLKDVVFFYDKGNPSPIQKKYKGDRDSLLPKTDIMLKKLNLTKPEVEAIVAFLQSITTTAARLHPPTNFPN
jgi:cytochrome c peroxidase